MNNKYDLYFRPFGSCAEVLTPGTVEKYFLPVIVSCFCFSFIIFYFSEIVQDTKSDGLKKHTQTRNSTLMGKVCCMGKDLNLWKWIKNKIYIVGVRFSIKGTFAKLVLKHSFLLVFQDFVPKFLESLTDDELKKEAKNEVKNDALSSIIKVQSFKFYCNFIVTFYLLFLRCLSYNAVISSVMLCEILLLRMISYNQLQKHLRHCTFFWHNWLVHGILWLWSLLHPLSTLLAIQDHAQNLEEQPWIGGRREVSTVSHRPVTSSDLKQERSFFHRSVSTFLQLAIGFFNQDIVIGCLQVILVPKVSLLLNLELNYREQMISKFKKKNWWRLQFVNQDIEKNRFF